jgi:SAM-dependent methyltransferase
MIFMFWLRGILKESIADLRMCLEERMEKDDRWVEAQKTEADFWKGVSQQDSYMLKILADNAGKVPLLQKWLKPGARMALEVGSGPLGVGLIGYLPEIPIRVAMDPLHPTSIGAEDSLRRYVESKRGTLAYVVGCGEEIPVRDESVDLAICCNVIDHASKPEKIMSEMYRVLRPGGQLFFDVHTFSLLGLAKWHAWTKLRHKEEILVKAHPHRMFEIALARQICGYGFTVKKLAGHTLVSSCIGRARTSTFVAEKCTV